MAWAEAVTAISTAVIAAILLVASIAAVLMFGEFRRLARELRRLSVTLDRDARPALLSVKKVIEDSGEVVGAVRSEIDAIVGTSQDLRERVEAVADTVEDRLYDLESLLDVVQTEVEDTALDVAAALRTTRRGGKLFRQMKRAILGRGR